MFGDDLQRRWLASTVLMVALTFGCDGDPEEKTGDPGAESADGTSVAEATTSDEKFGPFEEAMRLWRLDLAKDLETGDVTVGEGVGVEVEAGRRPQPALGGDHWAVDLERPTRETGGVTRPRAGRSTPDLELVSEPRREAKSQMVRVRARSRSEGDAVGIVEESATPPSPCQMRLQPCRSVLKPALMTAYGSRNAREDIAEYVAAVQVPETGEDYACERLRGHGGDNFPVEYAIHFAKLNFLNQLGFLTDEAFDRCVGAVV